MGLHERIVGSLTKHRNGTRNLRALSLCHGIENKNG